MYRTLDGRLSSGSKNVHVVMITTPGRRTGIPRSTCVRYLEISAGLVVWGTGSGSRRDPDWFQNLREVPTAQVQVREQKFVAGRQSSYSSAQAPKEVARAVFTSVILAPAVADLNLSQMPRSARAVLAADVREACQSDQ